VVIGEYSPRLNPFYKKAKENKSEIIFASDNFNETYPSELKGDYQNTIKNGLANHTSIKPAKHF